MSKRITVVIVTLIIVLLCSSCGLDYRYSLDEDKHNKIQVEQENENTTYFIYQDSKYVFDESKNIFNVITYETEDGYYLSYEDDVLISWNGYRYVWYIDEYYSYTAEAPLFIYNCRLEQVYFLETYDPLFDTFIIEGSDSEIVLNDSFTSTHANVDFVSQHKITLYSKQCQRIKTLIDVAVIDNQWYLRFPDSQEIWVASDAFVAIIKENNLS